MQNPQNSVLVRQLKDVEIEKHWPLIEQELDRVPHIWDKWWTKEVLHGCVLSGTMQLWGAAMKGAIHIVIFTQIVVYPANRTLQVFLGFGNGIDEMLPSINAALEFYAREHFCSLVEIHCRPGLSKPMKEYGFGTEMLVLTKPIYEQRMN